MVLNNEGRMTSSAKIPCDVLCNSDTKDVGIHHSSFVFYWQQLLLLAWQKSRLKLDKDFDLLMKNLCGYNLYLKTGMSSPDVFSKKGVLLQICFHTFRRIPIQKCDFSRVELTLLHGCSPVNWLDIEHLSWQTPLSDCFSIYGSEYNRY